MPRVARKAPDRTPDPLDDYSTWDIRIAKVIYYGLIIGTAVLILGIWAVLLTFLFQGGAWAVFMGFHFGFRIAIVAGAITGHLFLLVLFYTLFRGGMVKLCKALFKDRRLAKKWEDYTTLRLLIGVSLSSLYITILAIFIGLLPATVWSALWDLWLQMVADWGLGTWIFWVGAMIFLVVGIIFVGLVLWNHGVFWVLKHVKTIEGEMEVDERIKREALKEADERTLQSIYKKETGQKALHRGKETKGYIDWKKKQLLT
ncbi:hypothetical protein LCGC14_0656940 [marine sediment metagenome]|uniref:Uncharacterized protein n=1 Tax=marine sediment metagenome TaxID=412755 RepID=A0A0F9U336_9ZZZZ|nr:MAG: hypothetical protein Lokiarch_30760 [Candidatus Lokiarchaeum sp. GC14_75]